MLPMQRAHGAAWPRPSVCSPRASTCALATELDTPEARRDVSVSLNNVADAARARGDLAGAERLFAESLELRRALARELDTPEARRDVSVSLNNVANAARARGDLAAAERLFAESLDISRALATELDTPEACLRRRCRSTMLLIAARARGDLAAAEHLFAESLDIQAARSPPSLTRRRPVATAMEVSLSMVAQVLAAKGDLEGAQRLLEQGLAIIVSLKQQNGAAELDRDHALCHFCLAGIAEAQGDASTARAELSSARAAAEVFGRRNLSRMREI